MSVSLTILGAPRTKKNSQRKLMRGGHVFIVPSAEAVKWADAAAEQLKAQWRDRSTMLGPVHVCAMVYRERNIGDLVGFLQAIGDVLEAPKKTKSRRPQSKAAVIKDDRQIVSWDGSRLSKDAANPRVELVITEAAP